MQTLGFDEASAGAVVTSAVVAGACFGSLFAGQLAVRFGPRTAQIVNTLPLLVGSAVCAGASSLWTMLAGRILAGLGAGAASVLVPRYMAEVAPTVIRGALGTMTQVSCRSSALRHGWPSF